MDRHELLVVVVRIALCPELVSEIGVGAYKKSHETQTEMPKGALYNWVCRIVAYAQLRGLEDIAKQR